MNDLLAVIKQKKIVIAKLQTELDEARALLTVQRTARGREIVPTSSVGRTVEVLKRAGKPLHVDEIIKQIEAEGHKVNKAALVSSFSRYVRTKRVFYRAAPNVFGLLGSKKEN